MLGGRISRPHVAVAEEGRLEFRRLKPRLVRHEARLRGLGVANPSC
jgi:hypothetical protein